MNRMQSPIEGRPRRPSTRNTLIHVQVIPTYASRKEISFLPIRVLLFRRYACVSNQLAQTGPPDAPKPTTNT